MVHIYTGDGKGKTTAAVGLCVRAAGAGKRVFFAQFIKDGSSSEISSLVDIGVTCLCYPGGFIVAREPTDKEIQDAGAAFSAACEAALSGEFDVYVFDEILVCAALGLVPEQQIIAHICATSSANPDAELILTGRDAPKALIEKADLVTQMECVKHYFDKGVCARKGIEL